MRHRAHEDGLAPLVQVVDPGPVGVQYFYRLQVLEFHHEGQRRISFGVLRIHEDALALGEQHPDGLRVVASCGHEQGGVAARLGHGVGAAPGVDVGPALQKQAHDVGLAHVRGLDQRRALPFIVERIIEDAPLVHVHPGRLDDQLGDLPVLEPYRPAEHGVPVVHGVHVTAVFYGGPGPGHIVPVDGCHEFGHGLAGVSDIHGLERGKRPAHEQQRQG